MSEDRWPKNLVDVPFSNQLFHNLLTEGQVTFVRCKEGLPKGARFFGFWQEVHTDIVHLIYEHPSFPEVNINESISIHRICFDNLTGLPILDYIHLDDE